MTEGETATLLIVVRKDQQGRGIGSELLRYVDEGDISAIRQGRAVYRTGSLPHYELKRPVLRKNGTSQHAVLKDFYAAVD